MSGLKIIQSNLWLILPKKLPRFELEKFSPVWSFFQNGLPAADVLPQVREELAAFLVKVDDLKIVQSHD